MQDLIIKTDIAVKDSNLTAYAGDIKQMIASVNTELKTDDDFAEAKTLVTKFKKAEDQLKQAKERIFDTGDLKTINDTIVELGDLVRDTRLNLNRQVTAREKEIKKELIDNAYSVIEQAVTDSGFATIIEPADYNEVSAQIKGKRKIEAMQVALNAYTGAKIAEIAAYAKELNTKKTTIKKAIKGHETLFDINQLLLNDAPEELITARIKQHQAEIEAAAQVKAEQMAKAKAEEVKAEIKQSIEPPLPELDPAITRPEKPTPTEPVNSYVIRVSLQATHTQAVEVARNLAQIYGRENVQLTKTEEKNESKIGIYRARRNG